MIRENKKTIIVTMALLFVPVIVGLFLWDKLPEQLPMHWNAKGEINGYGSKAFLVFGLNGLLIALDAFCILCTKFDPKYKNISRKNFALVLWCIPAVSLFANGLTYSAALGKEINIYRCCTLLIAVVFLALGNYMPKTRQNYSIGIKLPWTLHSEENWNRTHRLAGKLWVVCGILLLVDAFAEVGGIWGIVVIAFIATLIPSVYSFCYYMKEKQEDSAMQTHEFICPVCGRYIFDKERDYEICPVCGWENDGFYEAGGANKLSLEEYKAQYQQKQGEDA